jgi:undecaprenyl-diphosphatase
MAGFERSDLPLFAAGLIAAFGVAYLVIKFFLGYVSRNTFKPFAWYRIVAGALMLVMFAPMFGS